MAAATAGAAEAIAARVQRFLRYISTQFCIYTYTRTYYVHGTSYNDKNHLATLSRGCALLFVAIKLFYTLITQVEITSIILCYTVYFSFSITIQMYLCAYL